MFPLKDRWSAQLSYGKRITGRHNDNTSAVVEWFVSQYRRILREDFAR